MHICIAGPVSLNLLNHPFDREKIPPGYPYPPMAQFVNAFLKRGHKVSVVSYSTGISKPVVLESENISLYIAKRREKHAARDFFKEEVKQMIDFFNSINCDIIISNWTYEISLAAIKSKQKKVTIRMHDYPPLIFRFNHSPYQFIRTLIHYMVTRKAKYLNANSDYLFSLLSKKIRAKTIVIPNFLSNEIFEKPKIPKGNYIITVSNGFSGHKNIYKGILAFAELRKKANDLEYYLVGSGFGENEEAYRFAKEKNVMNGIKFLGSIPYDETLKLISGAKIMLHPSLEESFGMSVLEAMALGTPVVGGAKSGNIPYLLGFGEYGIICDVTNHYDMANKLYQLLNDNEKMDYFSKRAIKYSFENYSENVVLSKFENYLGDILND